MRIAVELDGEYFSLKDAAQRVKDITGIDWDEENFLAHAWGGEFYSKLVCKTKNLSVRHRIYEWSEMEFNGEVRPCHVEVCSYTTDWSGYFYPESTECGLAYMADMASTKKKGLGIGEFVDAFTAKHEYPDYKNGYKPLLDEFFIENIFLDGVIEALLKYVSFGDAAATIAMIKNPRLSRLCDAGGVIYASEERRELRKAVSDGELIEFSEDVFTSKWQRTRKQRNGRWSFDDFGMFRIADVEKFFGCDFASKTFIYPETSNKKKDELPDIEPFLEPDEFMKTKAYALCEKKYQPFALSLLKELNDARQDEERGYLAGFLIEDLRLNNPVLNRAGINYDYLSKNEYLAGKGRRTMEGYVGSAGKAIKNAAREIDENRRRLAARRGMGNLKTF